MRVKKLDRRQMLGIASGIAALVAGCSSDTDSDSDTTPTNEPTPESTDTVTSTPEPTVIEQTIPSASDVDYRVVKLESEGGSADVRIKVSRQSETNETLHEQTYTLAEGETLTAYDSRNDGLGDVHLRIQVQTSRDNETIRWASCSEHLPIYITADEQIEPRLLVC